MKTKLTPIVSLSLLLAALALAGCSSKQEAAKEEEAERTLAIRAITTEERTFERNLTVQGTILAKNYANVAARTDGNLDEIWVDEGDLVESGKTALFQIDPTRVKNALTISQQDLAVSQASLAVAKASAEKTKAEAKKAALDFERYSRLHKENRVTDNEFESYSVANEQAKAGIAVAEAQVDLAERQVKSAEAAVAIAQENFNDSKITSPLTGAVSTRDAEPGEYIASGRVLLRIDDLSVLDAAAFLPAQYYPDVEVGKTEFHLKAAGKDVGLFKVTYRSPTIDTTLRTFEVKGRVKFEKDLIVPGAMADLSIVFETRKNIGVPSESILYRGGKPTVFVVESDHAATREVTIGFENEGWTEILDGLKAGEVVVTEGQTQLRDKVAVTIAK